MLSITEKSEPLLVITTRTTSPGSSRTTPASTVVEREPPSPGYHPAFDQVSPKALPTYLIAEVSGMANSLAR